MKHSGKAQRAAFRLIVASLILLIAIVGAGLIAKFLGGVVVAFASALLVIWILFVLFTLYFFRDPTAKVPEGDHLVVSPAHGTIDQIDETIVREFNGEKYKRVSIFLNVFNVHVQQSPVTGKVTYLKHTSGQFLNAMNADCADFNENVLLAFAPTARPTEQIGVRLIAGLIARRIIPWVEVGDVVPKGERISLVQFGSRANLYLPMNYQVRARMGDKVVGGETIIAERV
ncbi:MAG: putative phosphatidylserine decarboxylase [Verrucomicrobiales bacterium]|nr:putative phosphatidylserine decarboxylase [Verrucomicrobiales bacterium]